MKTSDRVRHRGVERKLPFVSANLNSEQGRTMQAICQAGQVNIRAALGHCDEPMLLLLPVTDKVNAFKKKKKKNSTVAPIERLFRRGFRNDAATCASSTRDPNLVYTTMFYEKLYIRSRAPSIYRVTFHCVCTLITLIPSLTVPWIFLTIIHVNSTEIYPVH